MSEFFVVVGEGQCPFYLIKIRIHSLPMVTNDVFKTFKTWKSLIVIFDSRLEFIEMLEAPLKELKPHGIGDSTDKI